MDLRIDVAIDCADPEALAAFWCEALDYRRHGSFEQYRTIVAPEGSGLPKLVFQQVPEAKAGKNRLHLDLIVGEGFEVEASRLEALGARRLTGVIAEGGTRWITLADPEGNEFCVCEA